MTLACALREGTATSKMQGAAAAVSEPGLWAPSVHVVVLARAEADELGLRGPALAEAAQKTLASVVVKARGLTQGVAALAAVADGMGWRMRAFLRGLTLAGHLQQQRGAGVRGALNMAEELGNVHSCAAPLPGCTLAAVWLWPVAVMS